MSLKPLRGRLEVGKVYTLTEVYNLVAKDITPELALHTYKRHARNKQTKSVLARDAAIVSGKRKILIQQLVKMVYHGRAEKVGKDGYKLLPRAGQSTTGVTTPQVAAWLQTGGWLSFAELVAKARSSCDEQGLLSRKLSGKDYNTSMSAEEREQRLDISLRARMTNILGSLRRQGRLDTDSSGRFRLRKFTKPTHAE